MGKLFLSIGVAGFLVCGITVRAEAAPITFAFTATITFTDPLLTPPLPTSGTVDGSLTYELSTLDGSPANPNSGFYPAVTAFSATIGGYTMSSASGSVLVNSAGGIDLFSAQSTGLVSGPPINGGTPILLSMMLQDNQGTSFLNDSLPTVLDASAFEFRQLLLSFNIPDPTCEDVCVAPSVVATITSFQVEEVATVPEPATLTLLGLGLAGFAMRRRRR